MDWFKELIEKSYDEEGNISLEGLVKEFDKAFSQNAVSKLKYDEVLAEVKEKGEKLTEYEKINIDELMAENERLKEREKQITENNAIEMALVKAGAKNLKAAKALIQIEGDFSEEKLKEQIESLTHGEDSSFLFEKSGIFYGSGIEESGGSVEKSFDEMSYSEMCEAMKNM